MPVTDVTTDAENLTMTVIAEFAATVERVWDAYADPRQLELDELWRTRLAALRQYVVENKCLPRYRKYGSDTERFLGVWLHNQHQRRSRGILSTWRLEALDSDLPGWRSRA